MPADNYSELTEGQQACLRMVLQHLTSKEIARALNISKDTVDQRLDRSRRLLGCATRFEAARRFAAFESQCHRVVYDTIPIVPDGAGLASQPHGEGKRAERSVGEAAVQDRETEYQVPARRRFRWPYARLKGQRNDLGMLERYGWIALIAMGIPVLLGSLFTGLWALGQVALALKRFFT